MNKQQETLQSNDESRELQLGKVPTKSLDDIFTEVELTSTVLAGAGPAAAIFAHDLFNITVELLHWIYDTSGTHPSPSEMVMRQIEQVREKSGKKPIINA